jgi:hypothetical protein
MAKRQVKKISKIADLTPDPENVNAGTERGDFQLDWSLTNLGSGRSILADADGLVIAGNKTLEKAAENGMPIQVVQTDGKTLVVVQRTDLRLSGEGDEATKARQMAIADNRISQTNYATDAKVLLHHKDAGVDIGPFYRDEEIAGFAKTLLQAEKKNLLDSLSSDNSNTGIGTENTAPSNSSPANSPANQPEQKFPLAIVLTRRELTLWQEKKKAHGLTTDTQALLHFAEIET